ncbi:MAG: hypothetical protein DRN27_08670 [Thermoplasmata archaeon]|nr:MAG: hypothetical protein DRN27_08670 [Thermoplasmata archaeon]
MIKKTFIAIIITAIVVFSSMLGYLYISDVSALDDVEINIEQITLEEIRLTYCKLNLRIDVYNPAHQDISEVHSNFDVSIAGNYVGKGVFPKSFIPAQSNCEKEVILTIYYADVTNAVINGIQNRNFDLTIEGEAKGKVMFNLFTVSKKFSSTYSYP